MDLYKDYSRAEKQILRKLSSPFKIQTFLDETIYNATDLTYSPREVLALKTAHCMDGALLAAAALRFHGRPPLLVDLRAENDDDHVVAIYKERGRIGAISKSNYSGLRFREPVYASLRELAMSYFEEYFNLAGQKTLREFSKPFDLTKHDRINWLGSRQAAEVIAQKIDQVRHQPLISASMVRALNKVDPRLYAAGTLGLVMDGASKA